MIKCILFDADGVTILSKQFSTQYQKEFGVSKDLMLPFFKGTFQKCMVGEKDLKEVIKPWLSKWKWEKSVDELLKFWFDSENNPNQKILKLIPKLKEKGILCCIATDNEKYRTNYIANKMGYAKIFDKIFSSAFIGAKKTNREYFEHIVQKLNLKPSEILFFDDSQKNIETAKQVGIQAYVYQGFLQLRKQLESLKLL